MTPIQNGCTIVSQLFQSLFSTGTEIPGHVTTNKALELYNLKNDAGENRYLALKQTGVRDLLLDELLAWQKVIGAPVPKEPNPKRVGRQVGCIQ